MPTAEQIECVLDQLTRGPALVRQLIYEVPPELRKRRPAQGVWSAHEHAVHLAAIYPIVVARLDQMLNRPEQPILDYEPSRDDPDDALLKLDLDTEMDRFGRERGALLERIKTLTPDQWSIAVEHTGYSHYGVVIMFRHLALHDLYHAYRIEDRLLRKEWLL
jgi:DinB superfamily